MVKKGESKQDEIEKQGFENAGFIDALIGENFVDFNPKRDICNVTFTFPVERKPDITAYIKQNGKGDIVKLILEEVERCQTAVAK